MDEIFYLMRHGGGGFSYSDCYNMPIQVRKYNVRKLSAEITAENEKANSTGKGGLNQLATGDPAKMLGKDKKPNYISKASRK